MKVHTTLLRHLFGIVISGAVMLAGSSRAQTGLDPTPVPNQECGTTCSFFQASAVTGTGTSTFATDPDSDKFFAENDADMAVKRKLAKNSGVVCYICESGLQCSRSVDIGGAGEHHSITTYTYIPGDGSPSTEGWTVTKTYWGDYTVSCAACPQE